jgi:hypothetical protein
MMKITSFDTQLLFVIPLLIYLEGHLQPFKWQHEVLHCYIKLCQATLEGISPVHVAARLQQWVYT